MPDSGASPPHLILIDGSGFIFRAFHALPPMTRPDGTPVNAVFGFTNMLAQLLKEHTGTHFAVIFDGGRATIVSSDKDLMQLIRPGVIMMDPLKKRPIGAAEVMEKFGVSPDKVIEVQALIGDSTDNVPGVPGIGPKGAAQLIAEYGDVESVLAAAPSMKPSKRRDMLIEHAG